MAATGSTPIQLYYSTTASAVPVNTNLLNGELAINITDGKLYYKDNGGTVRLLASNGTSTPVTTFSAGTTGLTPSTATSGAVTLAGTLATANGGTNLTSFTSGGAVYATSTSALTTGTLPIASGGTGSTTLAGASIATYTGTETLTNKTLTNPTVNNYTEGVVAIGNSSTAQTLSLTNGTYQTVTMTGNCTFTMPTATAGKSFVLQVNSGAGSFTGTFTSVKWPNNAAPTLTTTASRWDLLAFFSDGTNWYGNYVQAFQ